MTDIPETVLMKARPVLAYALTAANTGQPERALEIVARALMDERERCAKAAENADISASLAPKAIIAEDIRRGAA